METGLKTSTEEVGEGCPEGVPDGMDVEVPVTTAIFFLAFFAWRSLAYALVISTAKQKLT
ncbi:hypothetical protein A2U01_0067116, partial [Trifolium medium]|nr:hypothetical protein [Trifolium medium]